MQMIKKEGEKSGRRREKERTRSSDSSSSDSSRSPSPTERSAGGVEDARLRRLQAAKAREKEEQGS